MTWMRQDWNERVVAYLVERKAAGDDFDTAWKLAMRAHPPRGRDCGPERPALFGDGDPSLVACFRGYCEDAWHNRRPALAHFHASLLMERDGSRPVVRTRRVAA